MKKDIKFSVIIPVYNARKYIAQAVESALEQSETGEILLVEDGSSDGALEECIKLAKKYCQVKLLQHKDGRNMGPSISRNIGINNAGFKYIAFLDADDYYLPNRFKKTVDVFRNYIIADGVYEAVGKNFEEVTDQSSKNEALSNDLITIHGSIEPDYLFKKLMKLNAHYGSLHLDGLTVRKDLFIKSGYFNEKLPLHQDTELIWKMIALGRLFPGNTEFPVAIWRAHKSNRITSHIANKRKHYKTSLDMWKYLCTWSKEQLSVEKQYLVALRSVAYMRKADYFEDFKLNDFIASRIKMFQLFREYPLLLFNPWFLRLVLPSEHLFKPKS